MHTASELVDLLSLRDEEVAKLLDDTLINRLEYALYCDDKYHTSFWDAFNLPYLDNLVETIGSGLNDSEISCGKLKIKFAILWRLRVFCKPKHFKTINNVLDSLIISRNFRMISALEGFFRKNLFDGISSFFYNCMVSSHLNVLRDMHQTSSNLIHRRSIILVFILLLCSRIKSAKDVDELINFSTKDLEFLTDFLVELVKVSRNSPDRKYPACLNYCTESVVKLFTQTPTLIENEDFVYLLILLASYHYTNFPNAISIIVCSPKVGYYLRWLLANDMFNDCTFHRFLVEAWYGNMQKSIEDSSHADLYKFLTPLSTLQGDFLHHSSFRDFLPAMFISNLWKICINLLSQKPFTKVSHNFWLLFTRYCHLQRESRKEKQLLYLLAYPDNLADIPVVMDCIFTLYSNLSLTRKKITHIFEIVYDLAYEECLRLSSTGGCLGYSFLLLRIFNSSASSEGIAFQLLQLQTIVSTKLAEDPSLVANEAVIEIHRGLFLAPLLQLQWRGFFSYRICEHVAKLITELQRCKESSGDEQVFPGTLKGVLVACLLRCLECADVLVNLKTTNTYDAVLQACLDLSSTAWEEDPSIREQISECWNDLSAMANYSEQQSGVRDVVRCLAPAFSLIAPVRDGRSLCPSCKECVYGLLEDIFLSNITATNLDCVGD